MPVKDTSAELSVGDCIRVEFVNPATVLLTFGLLPLQPPPSDTHSAVDSGPSGVPEAIVVVSGDPSVGMVEVERSEGWVLLLCTADPERVATGGMLVLYTAGLEGVTAGAVLVLCTTDLGRFIAGGMLVICTAEPEELIT